MRTHHQSKTNRDKSFTLIEVLVVATIIALLAAAGAVSYSSLNRGSRDARRKADIEEMRAAFEQWRSDKGSYPTSIAVSCVSSGCCTSQVSLTSGADVYLQRVPRDPQCPTHTYYYNTPNSSDYTFGAGLESVTAVCQNLTSPRCGSGQACSYCMGSYGPKF